MNPPIVALQAAAAACIEAHLLRLAPQDRSLRFAAGLVTDETVRRYVASIRFDGDAVLGLVNTDGAIVGLAHGCVYAAQGEMRVEASFSVDAEWRHQGLGSHLMTGIEAFAKAIGARALTGVCVARNLPMRRIFERAGLGLTREDDEMHAFRQM